jgi:hypothetical protein
MNSNRRSFSRKRHPASAPFVPNPPTTLWGRINQNRTRWLLRLAAVLVAGLAVFLWVNRERTQDLIIENRSGQKITQLKVTIAGQTHPFRNVAMGSDVSVTVSSKGDDPLVMDGELADGGMIRSRFPSIREVTDTEPPKLTILPGGEVRPARAAKDKGR